MALSARATGAGEDGGEGVELSVSNTGPGIAAEHLPHIFDRYYRADAARSDHAHSAGLGLAIVRAIMELHGGKIWVDCGQDGAAGNISRTTFFLLFKKSRNN